MKKISILFMSLLGILVLPTIMLASPNNPDLFVRSLEISQESKNDVNNIKTFICNAGSNVDDGGIFQMSLSNEVGSSYNFSFSRQIQLKSGECKMYSFLRDEILSKDNISLKIAKGILEIKLLKNKEINHFNNVSDITKLMQNNTVLMDVNPYTKRIKNQWTKKIKTYSKVQIISQHKKVIKSMSRANISSNSYYQFDALRDFLEVTLNERSLELYDCSSGQCYLIPEYVY